MDAVPLQLVSQPWFVFPFPSLTFLQRQTGTAGGGGGYVAGLVSLTVGQQLQACVGQGGAGGGTGTTRGASGADGFVIITA